MAVWILHLPLVPYDEMHIAQRTHLPLPFGDVPDLSSMNSQLGCRQLMQALHPDEPPEAIMRRVDRLWPLYSGLQKEDIIVVPLPSRGEAALAEITGPYEYSVDESGRDVHQMPVRWHDKRISFRALGKHKELVVNRGVPLSEVTHVEARTLIRERLPHGYNRFAKFKWLLVVFFILAGIRFLQQMMGR